MRESCTVWLKTTRRVSFLVWPTVLKNVNNSSNFFYLCVLRPWCITIPKDTQSSWHAFRRMQISIDQSIWECFCRISCSCDFFGFSCVCCLTTHISFRFHCGLQKNIFYLSGHIRGQAFSILDLLFFEMWLDDSVVGLDHDLLTRWVPRLTITICNKITAIAVN